MEYIRKLLRTSDCRYRESADSCKISYFILFYFTHPFGELLSRMHGKCCNFGENAVHCTEYHRNGALSSVRSKARSKTVFRFPALSVQGPVSRKF